MPRLNVAVTWTKSFGAVAPALHRIRHAGASGVRVIAKGFEDQDDFLVHLREFGSSDRREARIPIMVDIPVERPTIGHLLHPKEVVSGNEYTLIESTDTGSSFIPVVGMRSAAVALEPGDILDVADGRVRFEVLERRDDCLRCVAHGSYALSAYRSIRCGRFRGYSLSERGSSLLDRDLSELGVRSVALSFVETASTLDLMRQRCAHWASPPKLIAKIESAGGVANLAEISARADGIMIGRGDLSFLAGQHGFMGELIRVADGVSDWGAVCVATGILGGLVGGMEASVSDISDLSHWVRLGVRNFLLSDFADAETTCRALNWFASQNYRSS